MHSRSKRRLVREEPTKGHLSTHPKAYDLSYLDPGEQKA
jgi:hypothetical protein